MDKKGRMRIIFMGTPDFAVPSLEILIDHGYNIVAVITATDKYGGRGGKKLMESEVKKCAVKHEIPVLQPKNLKSQDFLKELKSYNADLQIVVAFRMLPVAVWDMPSMGTYNLHGSLLPKYRGAAPINWAIIKGEKTTGVTSFKLKHEIDTGDILIQRSTEIGPKETAGELYNRLKIIGSEVVLETVKMIESGNITLLEQDQQLVTKAPKIQKEDCLINFDQDGIDCFNFIRGMAPYPGAYFFFGDQMIKVFDADFQPCLHNIKPGGFESDQKKYLKIAVPDGWLYLNNVQLQGKKRMSIQDFLNGTDLIRLLKSNA